MPHKKGAQEFPPSRRVLRHYKLLKFFQPPVLHAGKKSRPY
jgi:hypothetical protein